MSPVTGWWRLSFKTVLLSLVVNPNQGTTNTTLRAASFKLVWIDPKDNKTVLKDTRPARRHQPVTGDITSDDLPDLVLVATQLTLTNTGRLAALSYHILHHLRDQLAVY